MTAFNNSHLDPSRMPVLVHSIQNADAFMLAQKIWDANARTAVVDAASRKEIVRLSSTQPPCVVWMQRDQGRIDTFEIVLVWQGQQDDTIEVFTLSSLTNTPIGDASRLQSLLSAMLAAPATVPYHPN